MSSENGWEPARAAADQCEWVRIPGAEHVSLQFLKGWPSTILRAYAADYHAYIEPLRDADSAAWTPTNSVATSNHLNGTAMDLNWNDHPFRVNYAGFDQAKIQRMRELLAFYNFKGVQVVFWAQDWNSPKDAMHHQMGYNTWNNPVVGEFIRERIRADGFSTFKREAAPVSQKDKYALAVIAEGRKRGISRKGICIALTVPFVESGWRMYANRNVPDSLNYWHEAVGSDHDSTGLFQQRQAWGPLSCTMDPACSAGLFFDGGQAGQRGLTDFPYDTDQRTPGGWAQAVQVSAFPDRYDQHWQAANELYDRLAGIPTEEDDWMANPELERMIREVHAALFNRVVSESRYRHLGEGPRWQLHEMIRHVNAFAHEEFVEREAREGDPEAIALVYEIANADPRTYPDRQADAAAARRFLDSLTAAAPTIPQQPGAAAPTVVTYEPEITAELVEPDNSSVSQTVSVIAQRLLERAAQQVQKSLG